MIDASTAVVHTQLFATRTVPASPQPEAPPQELPTAYAARVGEVPSLSVMGIYTPATAATAPPQKSEGASTQGNGNPAYNDAVTQIRNLTMMKAANQYALSSRAAAPPVLPAINLVF